MRITVQSNGFVENIFSIKVSTEFLFQDQLVLQGHLQFPVTLTSTSFATVTMDTLASKTMLKYNVSETLAELTSNKILVSMKL